MTAELDAFLRAADDVARLFEEAVRANVDLPGFDPSEHQALVRYRVARIAVLPRPRVINMTGRRGVVPDGAVYVGRAVPRIGLLGHACANPFPVGDADTEADEAILRDAAIAAFAAWLRAQPDLVAQVRRELAGKVLACWCAPKPCHADVLARVADGGEP